MNNLRNIVIAMLLLPLSVMAQQLPRASSVPGGIAVIDLGIELDEAPSKPTARYKKNKVLVTAHNGRWLALVGLSLKAKPGSHSLQYNIDGKASTLSFQVKEKKYEEQHITLKNKRMVNPYKNDMTRIRDNQARSRKAFASWDAQRIAELGFATPVEGRLSGTFGKKRFFNGQPRRPHSGRRSGCRHPAPLSRPATTFLTAIPSLSTTARG